MIVRFLMLNAFVTMLMKSVIAVPMKKLDGNLMMSVLHASCVMIA